MTYTVNINYASLLFIIFNNLKIILLMYKQTKTRKSYYPNKNKHKKKCMRLDSKSNKSILLG